MKQWAVEAVVRIMAYKNELNKIKKAVFIAVQEMINKKLQDAVAQLEVKYLAQILALKA
jgi:hypothetical protein